MLEGKYVKVELEEHRIFIASRQRKMVLNQFYCLEHVHFDGIIFSSLSIRLWSFCLLQEASLPYQLFFWTPNLTKCFPKSDSFHGFECRKECSSATVISRLFLFVCLDFTFPFADQFPISGRIKLFFSINKFQQSKTQCSLQ